MGDLGQVRGVEQGQLDRAVLGQGFDLRGPQRGDPGRAGQFPQRRDPRLGDHPPVTHERDLVQPEPFSHRVDRGDERGRVAGVPGEHRRRDRTPGRVGDDPVLDLWFTAFAVPGMPPFRKDQDIESGIGKPAHVGERAAEPL